MPICVGVVGAGTMGSGIAQLAAQAGARTLLHDPDPEALESGLERISSVLARSVQKGRLGEDEAAAARGLVEGCPELAGLAEAGLVVEAAPERLELKVALFGALAGVVSSGCVLATNTSSLSIAEIAAATPEPGRVVGMHFFNPAPVMKLVEVVAGTDSSEAALQSARALAEVMGKRVIDASDVPGFLVNRCNRPYSLESLKFAEEGLAEPEQIDRIARMAGGFRMGPFELMDLIGIDVNHAVAETFFSRSQGEPRYRPSPLAAAKVEAGELGRKTGSGWFAYGDGEARPDDPEPPAPGGGGDRSVAVRGELPAAGQLGALLEAAGWQVSVDADEHSWLCIDFGAHDPVPGIPRLRHLHDGSLQRLDPEAAGFHLVPPLAEATAVEITSTSRTEPPALDRSTELLSSLGRRVEAVGDAPGLVLGRIVGQLINEASFLIGDGHGSPEDVDAGLRLGANHPRGPVEWSGELGATHVVTLLDALREELGEERYRVAPLLLRKLGMADRG